MSLEPLEHEADAAVAHAIAGAVACPKTISPSRKSARMKLNAAHTLKTFETPNASVTPLATRRLGANQVSVIRQRMADGHKNPTHTQTTEEVMVMLEGEVNVVVEGVDAILSAGDTLIVPANTPHSIENASGKPAEWLIVSPFGMQFFGPDGQAMTPGWAE